LDVFCITALSLQEKENKKIKVAPHTLFQQLLLKEKESGVKLES
jgi:hypothetical protein